MVGAVVAVVCLPVGALGSKVGVWGFQGGFLLLAVGTVLAAVVFFLGIVAYVYCMSRKLQAERGAILIGVVLSTVILAIMGSQFMAASSVPPIHNISTDSNSPPQFDKIVAIRDAENANPLMYDVESLAQTQREAYPQVQPLISNEAPADMLERAVQVMQGMGMDIIDVNAGAGRAEATDTTFWFGFKDDVVVRVRGEGSGSVVDVRSVSRVGQSDLGKNAARISEILSGLQTN